MKNKLLIIGAMLMLLLGFSSPSMAGIHIDVNVPLPPVFEFSVAPELVVIPGTYVYYCPGVDFDIFFYAGYWYRPYEGYWYRSVGYDGPWVYIASPPPVLVSLPTDYRIIARGERPIPYALLRRNWRAWERDRYWEHHNWGRLEHGHYGLAPSFRERGLRGYGGGFYGRVQHERQHGLAPSFRERGYGRYGGGVHARGGFRGGGRIHGGAGFHREGGHGIHGRR